MKKAIFFLALIIIPLSAFAGPLSNAATTVEGWFSSETNRCECPVCPAMENGAVCPDTPIDKIQRPFLELELGSDAIVAPANGSEQMKLENYHVKLVHNLSAAFYVYGSFAALTVDKNDYEGSLYDKKWQYQVFMGGTGIYLMPTVKAFVGIGQILADNVDGNEEFSMPYEWGIGVDIPIRGYKVVISWRSIRAPLKEETPHISRSTADGSMAIGSISLSLPIGN